MDPLHDTKSVAERLGCAPRTVQRMCSNREIRHQRIAGRYLIPESAVQELEQMVEPAPRTRRHRRKDTNQACEDDQSFAKRISDAMIENTKRGIHTGQSEGADDELRDGMTAYYERRLRETRLADHRKLLQWEWDRAKVSLEQHLKERRAAQEPKSYYPNPEGF